MSFLEQLIISLYMWPGITSERLIFILFCVHGVYVYVGEFCIMCASYMLARISLFNITRARVIVGVVDLYFIWRARELYMGGNTVGVVDIYFISRMRVMCGREYCWSGRSIFYITSARYIWAGNIVGVLIFIFFYHARASHVWAEILLKRLKILKCIFTVLPYFSILWTQVSFSVRVSYT